MNATMLRLLTASLGVIALTTRVGAAPRRLHEVSNPPGDVYTAADATP